MEDTSECLRSEAANKVQHFRDSDANDLHALKAGVGTSLIKQRREASSMRNQKNDEDRFCATEHCTKLECEVTSGNKAQMQEGVGLFRSMAILSDHRATCFGHTPGKPRFWPEE